MTYFQTLVWEVVTLNFLFFKFFAQQPQKYFSKLIGRIQPSFTVYGVKSSWTLSSSLTHFILIPYFQHLLTGAAETPRIILVRWPRCHLKLAGTKNSISDTPRRVEWEARGPGGKWRQRWVRNGEDETFPSSWQAGRQEDVKAVQHWSIWRPSRPRRRKRSRDENVATCWWYTGDILARNAFMPACQHLWTTIFPN